MQLAFIKLLQNKFYFFDDNANEFPALCDSQINESLKLFQSSLGFQ